jgi:thymidylate synthase
MNYLEIIKNVLANGTLKQATRLDNDGNIIPVENGTVGTFCEIFRHDMSKGFPLTTLRKMPWRSIRVELEGFIKGVTDKSWYQERKCGFWNEWANPVSVKKLYGWETLPSDEPGVINIKSAKQIQAEIKDLGPIYGYQWRNFDQHYEDFSIERRYFNHWKKYTTGNDFWDYHGAGCSSDQLRGHVYGFDQFKSIVDKLKSNPYDRRMVCSAWNPNQMDLCALPPCHWGFNVVVYGNKLNLIWHQRSCDATHGIPSNIASYGLLLILLCEESGLQPGELVGTLADCHVYENTMESAKQLVSREENELPFIKIKRKDDGSFSIFDWTWDQVELTGYNPHPPIDMGKVTV